jgi:hypothetical protein
MIKSILFTNARDERNILEWVVHHLNLGFNEIHILDHKSVVPINKICINLPNNVKIIRTNKDVIKQNLIKSAHNYAINNGFDWMIYLDADEFLVLNKCNDVNTFLKDYLIYDQVGINWLIYGSNYRDTRLNCDETIIGTYKRSQKNLNCHIKTFLNLKINKFDLKNPHVYILDNMKQSINVNFSPLDINEPWFFNTSDNFLSVNAFIAHYMYQSYDEFIEKKFALPRDDTGKYRTIIDKDEFHNLFNDIDNNILIEKYDSKNKELIELYKNKNI